MHRDCDIIAPACSILSPSWRDRRERFRGRMKKSRFLLAGLVAILSLLWGSAAQAQGILPDATAEPGVVRFILFYSDTCPHCHEVMENYLPTVYEKYGNRVEHQYINIHNNTQGYQAMLMLQTSRGVPQSEQGYIPALIIGDHVLVGGSEIPAELEGLIDQYLAQGGVDYPSLEGLPTVAVPTPEPAVQVLVFFDQADPSFQELSNFLVGLSQQYGSRFQPYAVDMTSSEAMATLNSVHEALGLAPPTSGIPEVLIDRRLLVGLQQIEAELPGLVSTYLAQGGSTLPSIDELLAPTPAPGASPTPAPAKAIYLAYFEQVGCQECARTVYDLQVVVEQYPQVVVERFAIEEAENKALNEWLGERFGVPDEKRLSTPMVFVGQDVLIGQEAILDNLLPAVARYAESGAPRTWDEFNPEAGEEGIVARFRSLGALTVLGAGLIDGLNPCAFATLVFFVSYMAFTGRRGREILFVGLAFTLGVFLTYLLVGMGLLTIVQSLGVLSSLGRWVYLLTALLCATLAVLTFRDLARARRGKPGEMTLKLPSALRKRIHKVIREGARVRAFVGMALVTGFLVSLIELACTGQVYLPTIVYVLSRPELAARAFLYLFLYCLMFVLPLIVVFVLSYLGTTSQQMAQFVNRHTASVKLLTGLVFVGLALWMTWAMAPLFGVVSPWTWVLMAGVVVLIFAAAALLQRKRKAPARPTARQRRSRA
jgi:cytochrome c biogenesis protein CcdA/glutaredoxin